MATISLVLLLLQLVQTGLAFQLRGVVHGSAIVQPAASSSPCSLVRCCATDGLDPIPGEEPAAAPADVKAEKKALREAIAALEAKLPKARGDLVAAQDAKKDAGENGYMLLAANFERFRQQARSELDSQKGYGKIATARALVSFPEAFDALQQGGSAAEAGDDAAPIHKYYGGIYKQTQQLLAEWKLQQYAVVAGEMFDARRHEVVERVASNDVAEGVIIEPVDCGWEMDGQVVRPAKCVLSTGAPKEEAAVEEAPAEGADDAAGDAAEA